MCVKPCELEDGREVACRWCWQCRENRVNDLVGRCIAEREFSKKTYAVTLTYAEKAGVKAVSLVYKDVQIFLKRLRRLYDVRYICAGEYGTEKGRAHWHIILFFKGASKSAVCKAKRKKIKPEEYPRPENMKQLRFGEQLPPNEYRVDWEPWDHGFSYFQIPQFNGVDFRYILKYAMKRQDLDSVESQLTMSKKPPLGHEFFMKLAKQHVDEAVIPRSYKYKVAGVRKRSGQENIFMMQGKTRKNFMNAFKKGWISKYGKEPTSEFFEEWDETNYDMQRQEPVKWEKMKFKGKEIDLPIFDDKENIKRIHHKDVMYVQPWVSYHQDIDLGVLMEVEYFGNDIVIHGKKGENAVYEDGEWRSVDEINEYVTHGKLKRIRSFRDVQREEQERLLKLHDNR